MIGNISAGLFGEVTVDLNVDQLIVAGGGGGGQGGAAGGGAGGYLSYVSELLSKSTNYSVIIGAIVRCRQGKIWKGLKEEDITEEKESLHKWLSVLSAGSFVVWLIVWLFCFIVWLV